MIKSSATKIRIAARKELAAMKKKDKDSKCYSKKEFLRGLLVKHKEG